MNSISPSDYRLATDYYRSNLGSNGYEYKLAIKMMGQKFEQSAYESGEKDVIWDVCMDRLNRVFGGGRSSKEFIGRNNLVIYIG